MNGIEKLQLSTVRDLIAYQTARADIETRLPGQHSDAPAGWWYDTTGSELDEYAEDIALALRYLQLSGLLLTHPECEHLVRPLDREKCRRPGRASR